VVDTGTSRLERELEALVTADGMWSLPQRPQKNVGVVTTTTNDLGRPDGPDAGGREQGAKHAVARGEPVVSRGGPTVSRGGPAVIRGGPAGIRGGPAMIRGGPGTGSEP
jgi:hypothetical protein